MAETWRNASRLARYSILYCTLLPLLLSSCSFAAPGYLSGPDPLVQYSVTHLLSNARQVEVERFSPAGEGLFPAVILVHGADGLALDRWGHAYTGMAQALARSGYLVFVPHYFESTGTRSGDQQEIKSNFVIWMHTVQDVIDFARKDAQASPERVGLVGISLGASLSLCTAAVDSRVGALVEFAGSFPEPIAAALVDGTVTAEISANVKGFGVPLSDLLALKHMPPTLILHGTNDTLVPVTQGFKVKSILEQHHVANEIQIYPGQGHFLGRVYLEAAQIRTVSFFDRFLK